MSGDNVAYNLRPNKFVERQLFVELLSYLCSEGSPEQYIYVSMGGPQLEDSRLVHQRLGFKNLISIEENPIIHARQQFNLRPSYIMCQIKSVADFVDDFDEFQTEYYDKDKIIWFDYASPRERRQQLVEYETVLSQLEEGDILKITMNAHPGTLGERRRGESTEYIQKVRRDALLEQLDGYINREIDHLQVTKRNLPITLAQAIKYTSIRALQTSPKYMALPLCLFVYQDGPHQMLTVTVRVTKVREARSIRQSLTERGWEFLPPDNNWQTITRINVPNLSAKERLYLEHILFADAHETIHEKLPFRFHLNESVSLNILQEYARHYRRYPSFFQVIL